MRCQSTTTKNLVLSVGDRAAYVSVSGVVWKGEVIRVIEWPRKEGFTYHVKWDGSDDGDFGQVNSTCKYTFKDGDAIPEGILQK